MKLHFNVRSPSRRSETKLPSPELDCKFSGFLVPSDFRANCQCFRDGKGSKDPGAQ